MKTKKALTLILLFIIIINCVNVFGGGYGNGKDGGFSKNIEKTSLETRKAENLDIDLKEAFKKKLSENPDHQYFIFDGNNDDIPELYIVNTDKIGHLNNSADSGSVGIIPYEVFYYGYENSSSQSCSLITRKGIGDFYFYSDGTGAYSLNFYNVKIKNTNHLVLELNRKISEESNRSIVVERPEYYAVYNGYHSMILSVIYNGAVVSSQSVPADFFQGKLLDCLNDDGNYVIFNEAYSSYVNKLKGEKITLYDTSNIKPLEEYIFPAFEAKAQVDEPISEKTVETKETDNYSNLIVSDKYGWQMNSSGVITSCYYENAAVEKNGKYVITIPYSINGTAVTGLDDEWLQLDYDQMKDFEIYIPTNITYMGSMSLHNGPICSAAEHPKYYIVKGSYADTVVFRKGSEQTSGWSDSFRTEYVDSVEKAEISDNANTKTGETEAEIKGRVVEQKGRDSTTQETDPEYVYGEAETVPNLPVSELDNVKDAASAAEAVEKAVGSVSEMNGTTADYITLFAEEAIARAASVSVEGTEIVINDDLIGEAVEAAKSAESEISKISGYSGKRGIKKNIRIVVNSENPITVSKEKLSSDIDKVTLITPYGGVSFKNNESAAMKISKGEGNNKIDVSFDKLDNSAKISVNFPGIDSDNYKAVTNENNEIFGGKYNPISKEISAKIDKSGIYSVITNEKSFNDIKNKSAEMQEAIKLLASKGIISGTSETEFSPDKSISRAETAAIILREISKLDPNAVGSFKDVSKTDWFCSAAGSSQKAGIIKGYEDNTFRGNIVIPKVQIVSVSARVLKEEMDYYDVENAAAILSESYTDSEAIAAWAHPDVALATDAGMVIRRIDNKFGGEEEMTRGDAAIILKRLFDKLW